MIDMSSYIKMVTDSINAQMEVLYEQMPLGSYLCVHEPEYDLRNIGTYQEKFEICSKMHVILSGESCGEPGKKTVYGPKMVG